MDRRQPHRRQPPQNCAPRFRRIKPEEIAQICVALGWKNKAPVTK